jgi:hypothetical protein
MGSFRKQWDMHSNNSSSKNLYNGSVSKIKIGNKLSDGFPVTNMLRQGCCISPTLFNIYLEQALGVWKTKCMNMGIPTGDNTIYRSSLGYVITLFLEVLCHLNFM